jgi:glutamate formiminotransferase
MPILAVPNWSIGRERTVLRQAIDFLESTLVTVHFAEADIDHNRTVTAISGTPEKVQQTLLGLAEILLPAINLQRHTGVHPRIGGLDVCPFIPIPELGARGEARSSLPAGEGKGWGTIVPKFSDETNSETIYTSSNSAKEIQNGTLESALHSFITETAQLLSQAHNIPIFLYEHSAPGKTLPNLREGGFGELINRPLNPDFGPNHAHPHLGATVLGWRDFLIALNINFPNTPGAFETMKHIAAQIRHERQAKNPLFTGIRALGLELQAQEIAQVSLNITQPDSTNFDKIISYIEDLAAKQGHNEPYTQLIGVIRDTDIERTIKIHPRPAQIVPTRQATSWQTDWNQL